MRHDMVEHHRQLLERVQDPQERAALRQRRVGDVDDDTGKPVTDADFDTEMSVVAATNQWALEHYAASELFWVTRDMTRVAMDASTDIPAWIPAAAVPAMTGLLIWAEPLPRLCWYGSKDKPMVNTDAVQWHCDDEFVDIDFLTRTDQLVADGHLQSVGRRGPFTKVRGTVLSAHKPTPPDANASAAEPGLIASLGATWTLMQIPTVATPRQITGAGGSGRQWRNQQRKVSIIDLRRLEHRDTSPADPVGRTYRHRWYVRGHWRDQAYGPGRALRRPTWVPGYVKGPADAPIKELERVTVWRR